MRRRRSVLRPRQRRNSGQEEQAISALPRSPMPFSPGSDRAAPDRPAGSARPTRSTPGCASSASSGPGMGPYLSFAQKRNDCNADPRSRRGSWKLVAVTMGRRSCSRPGRDCPSEPTGVVEHLASALISRASDGAFKVLPLLSARICQSIARFGTADMPIQDSIGQARSWTPAVGR